MDFKRMRTPVQARVIDGVLTIEVGTLTLAFAAENGPLADHYDPLKFPDPVKVLDHQKFAEEIARELMRELGEDGSTPLTHVLDHVIEQTAEQGSPYLRFPEDDDEDFE